MARKKRLTAGERIRIVQDILEGKTSQSAASRKNGINCSTINEWVRTYKVEGTQGLTDHKKNRSYSPNNLGHSSAAFTMNVYAHASKRMKKRSAENMERYIQEVRQ